MSPALHSLDAVSVGAPSEMREVMSGVSEVRPNKVQLRWRQLPSLPVPKCKEEGATRYIAVYAVHVVAK